jgi:hypothetical protein
MEAALPRVLTKLKITEVSAVDRGAGEGVRILLMKRADDEPHVDEARRAYFLKIFTKADAADDRSDDAGDRSDENTSLVDHPVVQMARLLVASGKFGDHGQALNHLLNTSNGQALLARMHKATDQPVAKESTMDTSEHLDIIMKRFGPEEFAEHICKTGIAPCTEAEFVSSAAKHEHALHPELRPNAAYTKLHERSESVRRACIVLKSAPLQVGGAAAQALDDPAEAIAQLKEEGRRRWPTASEAQQFANAMSDPALAVLASKAHIRPSPTTSYQFPR